MTHTAQVLAIAGAITGATWALHALGLAGRESAGFMLGALVFAAAIRGLIR